MNTSSFNSRIEINFVQNVLKDSSATPKKKREVVFLALGRGHSVENLTRGCDEEVVAKINAYAKQRWGAINALIEACNQVYVRKDNLLTCNTAYFFAKNKLQESRKIFKQLGLSSLLERNEGIETDTLKYNLKLEINRSLFQDALKDCKAQIKKSCDECDFEQDVRLANLISTPTYGDPSTNAMTFKLSGDFLADEVEARAFHQFTETSENSIREDIEAKSKLMSPFTGLISATLKKEILSHLAETISDKNVILDILKSVQAAYDEIKDDEEYLELKAAKKNCLEMLQELSKICSEEELLNHKRLMPGAKEYLRKKIMHLSMVDSASYSGSSNALLANLWHLAFRNDSLDLANFLVKNELIQIHTPEYGTVNPLIFIGLTEQLDDCENLEEVIDIILSKYPSMITEKFIDEQGQAQAPLSVAINTLNSRYAEILAKKLPLKAVAELNESIKKMAEIHKKFEI